MNLTRRTLLTGAAVTLGAGAAGATTLSIPGRATIGKNLVTDYGAVPDGITDCTTAFTNFRTFALTQNPASVLLYMPPGSYVYNVAVVSAPFAGIRNLTVSAYGATILFTNVLIVTARAGYPDIANKSARLQTVNAGNTTATLITAGDAANFAVGNWCSLTALEMQGSAGYPPNFHYNQFVKITGISGGTISFFPAATQVYSSQYPVTDFYPSAPNAGYDTGGPATLFKMHDRLDADPASWDTQVDIYGLTFNYTGAATTQIYGAGRSLRYVDCTFTACAPICTANKFFSATNCTVHDVQIEVDKNCEYVEYINCNLKQILFQSSSVQRAVIDGCTLATSIQGSPRRLLIKGATSAPLFQAGVAGYGATEEVIIESPVVISSLAASDSNRQPYSAFTQSGGNLTGTVSLGTPLTMGIPGTLLALATSTRKSVYGSICSDLTASGFQPVLHTTFADPLPTLPATYGTPNYVKQHPCSSITVEAGVTGCPQILALAGGPTGQPLFNFMDYTSDWIAGDPFDIRGLLISITINVIRAYTGGQSTANFHFGGTSDNTSILLPNGTAGTYGPIVNTKIAGTRVITPTTVTGAQSGDTLGSAPGLIWFVAFGGIAPKLVGSFGGDTAPQLPSVRVTVLLNQVP